MTDAPAAKPVPKLAYMITNNRVSILLNGRWRSFHMKSQQGQDLVELLRAEPQDIERIGELADIITWIAKQTDGRVTVDECDRLYLDNKPIDFGLSGRIASLVEQGLKFDALARFIENVAENPDPSVKEDLFRFMEKGSIPFDPDGYILVFKKVDPNYLSYASGSDTVRVTDAEGVTTEMKGRVRYPVGAVVEMDREQCDPNRARTCSRGLHGCSYEYLNYWYPRQGVVIIGRIHPKDVTAIPADHNDQKLRTCRMEIVGEIDEAEAKDHFAKVVDERYPPKPTYPTWETSDDGRLAGGPALDEQGREMGWCEVGAGDTHTMVWTTKPEEEDGEPTAPADAVNDGPLKFVPLDGGEAVTVRQIGFDEGYVNGRKDKANDYTPDNAPGELPGNVTEPRDRDDYCAGYAEGYDKGYAEDADPAFEDDEPQVEAEPEWTTEIARQRGKAAGIVDADQDFSLSTYDNKPDKNPAWQELVEWIEENEDTSTPEEHDFMLEFERAYRDAYHTRHNAKSDDVGQGD
jgi:hypothetical protein